MQLMLKLKWEIKTALSIHAVVCLLGGKLRFGEKRVLMSIPIPAEET